MVTYTTDELYSATDIAKNFSSIAAKLSKHEIEKIGILKNNKLDFVMLRSDALEELIKKEVQKALFAEDKKFVTAQLKKIKTNTATFYTAQEVEAKLNEVISTYER